MFVVKSSKEKRDTDKLKEIYNNSDEYNYLIRKEALKVLGEIGGKKIFSTLVQASKDKYEKIREEAAFAIGRNPEGKEHHLIDLLNDKNVDVRIAAIISIRNIDGITKAIDPLIKLLEDPEEKVRIEAIKTLGILDAQISAKDIAKFLNDKSEMVRLEAIKTLGKLKFPDVLDSLTESLKDKNSFIRREAVGALGRIGDNKSIEPLLKLLEDENRNVVLRTIKALGEIGGERAIDPLIKLLKSDDEFIKWEAMWALGRSKTPKAENLLIEALEEKDEKIIRGAAKILSNEGVKRAIDKIIEVISKKNYEFSSTALLSDISLSVLTLLFQHLIIDKAEVKSAYLGFLKKIKDKITTGVFSAAIINMVEESKKETIIFLGNNLILSTQELRTLRNSTNIEDSTINKFLNEFFNSLRSKEYIREKEKELEENPNDADTWYTQGNNYIDIKDWQKAANYFQKATELDPQMADAWNGLGWSLGQIGQYDKTLEYCQKAVDLDPNAAYSWHSIGWAYNKLGKYEKAKEKLEKALELQYWHQPSLFDMGFALFKLKQDYERMTNCFDELRYSDEYEDNPEYWNMFGIAQKESGDFRGAYESFKKLLELQPDNQDVKRLLEELEESKNEQLLNDLIENVRSHPDDRYYQDKLAYEYLNQKKFEKAIENYLEILRKDPEGVDNNRIMYNIGFAYRRMGNYEKEIEWYLKSIDFNNEWETSWNNLILAYCKIKDYEKSAESGEEALKIFPNSNLVWNNTGWTYGQWGQYEKAYEYCKKAIELNPMDQHALHSVGWALNGLKKYQEAIEYFERAIYIEDDYSPRFDCGKSYLELGNHQKAMQYLKIAVGFRPQSKEAWYYLGIAHKKLNNKAESEECVKKALEIDPDYEEALKLLKEL